MTKKAGACGTCGEKKCKASIGPYNKNKCKKGSQAHHIIPDYTLRTGLRPTNIKQSNDGRIHKSLPSLNDGITICLKGSAKSKNTTEHKTAHEGDHKIAKLSQKGKPPGTVSLGQALKHSRDAAIKAKPECEKEIRKAVQKQYKGVDRKMRVRGIENPNDLSADAKAAFSGNTTAGR